MDATSFAAADGTKRWSPLSGHAAVGIAGWVETDDRIVARARIGATPLSSHPSRLEAVEDELMGTTVDTEALTAAADCADESIPVHEIRVDRHASATF